MYIVIVGDGKVGYTLAEYAVREGYNVVVIDSNSEVLHNASEALDVICVKGNGCSSRVQLEAGVANADVLVAATSSDETNMICCLIAKKIGAKNTIARIRNPEYAGDLKMLQQELGLSMVINPEQTAAYEISRLLRFPAAANIETFQRGRVEMVEFRLSPDSSLAGRKIADIPPSFKDRALFCAVTRDGTAYIPDGSFVLMPDDHVHVCGDINILYRFFKHLGLKNERPHDIIIIGGGRITYYLTHYLNQSGMTARIIELNKKRCETLCELLPENLVIHGDGTEQVILESEGIDTAGAFIALTDRDEENIIASMLAKNKRVPKIITKVNRNSYAGIMSESGIDSVVCPKNMTAGHIMTHLRGLDKSRDIEVETLQEIVGGRILALEFAPGCDFRRYGVKLSELSLKHDLLIAVIVRDGKIIIPSGHDVIKRTDRIIVVTLARDITCLNDILR